MNNNQDEVLGYTSTASMFDAIEDTPVVNSRDEVDEPTLLRVEKVLKEREGYYANSVAALNLEDKIFTIEQQLAVNQMMVANIQSLLIMVQHAINNVKEARDARRQE